jgi:hypothetical protein
MGSGRAIVTNWVTELNGEYPAAAQLTLNIATTGINGLYPNPLIEATPSSGSVALPVLLLGDSSGTSAVVPALVAYTSPPSALPVGYDSYSLLGFIFLNSSGTLDPFNQAGEFNERSVTFANGYNVLTAGHAVTQTTLTLPVVSEVQHPRKVMLNYSFTSAVATDSFSLTPTGLTIGAEPPILVTNGVIGTVTGQVSLAAGLGSGNWSIDYKLSNAASSLSLWLTGFDFEPVLFPNQAY